MIFRKLTPPAQLAIIFLLYGTLWILLTDFLLSSIASMDVGFFQRLQTFKGMFFIVLSAGFVYFVSSRIISRQRTLDQQLKEQEQRYENELAQEVFKAQESERKKIGEELHDNVNQLLGVVKLYIEHAQVNPASKEDMLRRSSEYLTQAINAIRALSRSLVSPTLADIGLIESIREMIDNIRQLRDIEIELHHKQFAEYRLSDIQRLMVYRITQEQLNNILKHSRAEHVEIELRSDEKKAFLSIEDDGMGFNVKEMRPGVGLINIRHRLELFNGSMHITSAPAQGCKLEAHFELNELNEVEEANELNELREWNG